MAEPVIFGGSPLDQYLRDTEQAGVRPGIEGSDYHNSASESLAHEADFQHAFTSNSTSSTPLNPIASAVPTSSTDLESTALPSSAAGPYSIPKSSNGVATSQDATYEMPQRSRSQVSAPHQRVEPAPTQPVSAPFSSQFAATLQALIQRFFLPLVYMIARDVFGQRSLHEASSPTASPRQQSHAFKSYSRAAANKSPDEGANSFIEKFKYAICSSFLLTPSLSISFYESSPPFQTQSPTAAESTKNQRSTGWVAGRRASSVPIIRQGYVEPLDAHAATLPYGNVQAAVADEHRLPRLDVQGRRARNAALLSAFFLLPPISKSWQLWFSTVLLVTSLVWGFILFLGHSALDDRISFTLSRRASPNASASATSLRNLSTSNDLSPSEKAALQRGILSDVSTLIKAAQRFDVSINKAISAIQEVEIVSRGYKLTHPLPPISRIEAATSNAASPSRQRRSMMAPLVPATSKLARSLSGGGNGAPTIRRHTQRPLSLTLSNGRASPFDRSSGRVSPATFAEAGELDLTQRLLAEQSEVALAAAKSAPQRLVELRKGLVLALEEVGATCTSSTSSLHALTDAEELALLHDLYALDATSQDDANDADADADADPDVDASHAWSNGDTSALSEGSPDLDQDRKTWVATTPRNFGSRVRSADVSSFSDVAWRPEASPQTASHHKRLSLVSDGGSVLDRHPRAASSLSRRSSLVSDSGNMSAYRSPRFNYVSDKSAAATSGPNESAAAKRLSYVSNSSVTTGSFDTRSPAMRNSSIVSSTFSPPHSSAQTYSAATSPQSRATKRSSILGPNSIFAQLETSIPASARAEPADPLSLLSIKAKFEWMHRARRRWLCHLLALRLTVDRDIMLTDGARLPCDEYWTVARSAIELLRSTFVAQDKSIAQMVAKEMGPDFIASSKGDQSSSNDDKNVRSESRNGLLTVPNGEAATFSVTGHPGIEDRLHAMMLSLRSLQSKIRVCAEDIRVKPPSGLHGADEDTSGRAEPSGIDDSTIALQLDKTLESMRDDLLGLSAEWEATIKLVHKEKRRSPSPNLSTDVESDVAKANAARDLESPLEADEDAAPEDEFQLAERGSLPSHEGDLGSVSDDDDDDDTDLAELLLRSTSAHSLPPPGLEQVFESIAGIAGLSGLGVDGKKASRAERIEQARRQRQLEQERSATDKASHRHTMDPSGMMSELSDVIQSRKAVREQRHRSALPPAPAAAEAFAFQPSAPSAEDQPALALGSPLDLGPAGREGVFGAAHTFVDDSAVPRRSLSSLDLARARALQSLEARSPSAASSAASLSMESDESQPRASDDFAFEPTALESVPEDEAAAATQTVPIESPSAHWDSTSRKSTPKASHAPLSTPGGEVTPGPDSPFDLGAQVAAYARRQRAAKAAAMQASGSESSVSSQV